MCPERTAAKFGSEVPLPEPPTDAAVSSQVLTATGIFKMEFLNVYVNDRIRLITK